MNATPSRVALVVALLALPGFGQWTTETQELTAAGVVWSDLFGESLAIADDRIVVGAPETDGERGAAYVFVRTPAGWVEEAKLVASDATEDWRFGDAVAIEGTTAVVGSPASWGLGSLTGATGAAYVFERGLSGWSEVARLPHPPVNAGAMVGWSVAIDQDRIAVGMPRYGNTVGAVLAYVRGPGGWAYEQTVIATGPKDEFGSNVALDGDRLLATNGADSAYVFDRGPSGWVQQGHIQPPTPGGRRWALRGDVVVATRHEIGGGFLETFEWDEAGWRFVAKVDEPQAPGATSFGMTGVAFDGSTIVVGAWTDSVMGTAAGTAWAFQQVGGVWKPLKRLVDDGATGGDHLGWRVALDRGIAVVSQLERTEVLVYEVALSADVVDLSVSSGGAQSFTLAAGLEHAGLVHFLLGSISGTSPGVTVDGVTLPLNPDTYTLFTMSAPNAPPLSGSLGTLDATGSASAAFTVPPGTSPALVGLRLDHAFAVLDPAASPFVRLVSNPMILVLTP